MSLASDRVPNDAQEYLVYFTAVQVAELLSLLLVHNVHLYTT